MNLPLYLVDAFAERPFTGNPAAVTILREPRDADWMQALAMEMNQAETAFLHGSVSEWSLRWFTPTAEVALCGHATLAAAHVLWTTGRAPDDAALRFATKSGVLTATHTANAITLDLPSIASQPTLPPTDVASVIGADVLSVWRGDFDLLCVVDSAATVRRLTPDLGTIAGWDVRGVVVTAAGDSPGIDFVSRCFYPALGIPEDPVTGSAHCALAPWWSAQLGRSALVGAQLSRRGGVVECRVAGNRVMLTGRAFMTIIGEVVA